MSMQDSGDDPDVEQTTATTDAKESDPVTWIKVVPFDDDEALQRARAAQQQLYPIEYAEPTHPHHAQTDGIVAAHSLFPDVLHHTFSAFGALMAPDLPLSRRQHEMITTVVSATNRCQY